MQEVFSSRVYFDAMAAKSNLRQLREATGLSVREFARQVGESATNVSYWERSGNLPRSDVLAPMAKALGVSVEALLGEPTARQKAKPGGKAGTVFEAVSKLPRRQQQKILEVVEAMVEKHSKAA